MFLEILEKDAILEVLVVIVPWPDIARPSLDMKLLPNRRRSVPITLGIVLTFIATLGQGKLASDKRQLSFYHTHTGKSLDVIYWQDGRYLRSALDEINHFLSDFRTGDVVEIDPTLLDLIYDVREELDSDGTYQIVSAYRSPETNEMLRGRSPQSGVSKKSQHLLGKAIDVRLEGIKTAALRDKAIALKRGGVGYYQASDFVHLDTGRVRRW